MSPKLRIFFTLPSLSVDIEVRTPFIVLVVSESVRPTMSFWSASVCTLVTVASST